MKDQSGNKLVNIIEAVYFQALMAETKINMNRSSIYWGRVQSKFGLRFGFGLLVSGCLAFMQEMALGSISIRAKSRV